MSGPAFANEWICLQPGARDLYATPRAMLRHARLRLMITDFWAGPLVRRLLGPFRAMAGRSHPEIPSHLVRSFNLTTLIETLGGTLRPPRDARQRHLGHIAQHAALARRALRVLRAVPVDPSRSVYFTYKTSAEGPQRWMKDRGAVTVYGMYDPGEADERMIAQECENWPDWARIPGRIPDEYHRLVHETRSAADIIVVNSEWSRRNLLEHGIPASRIVVAPLAYEGEVHPPDRPKRLESDRKLRVLWLGQIALRKGIPYLFQAAGILAGHRVEFVVAGWPAVNPRILDNPLPNVNVAGYVPRAEALRLLRESDIFVLPTLSDGFAIAQLEAMAHGLPVIATPNCGQVVTDGEDGFIIPIRDPQALADRIMAYVNDPELLPRHSQAALQKIHQFTLERYANELNRAVDRFRAGSGAV